MGIRLLNGGRKRVEDAEPRAGDDVVTLTLDLDSYNTLDGVLLAMSHEFVRAAHGQELRKVLKWDPHEGCIVFVVVGRYQYPGRTGCVTTNVDPWPAETTTNLEAT